MRRDIKFRAWDKEFKRFSERALNHNINDINLLLDYEWMQYTGLKDKIGREIFEGDILKEYYEGEPDILVVSFEDGCFMVRQINTPNADYTLNGCDLGNTLVIGNIYENPELIKGDIQ